MQRKKVQVKNEDCKLACHCHYTQAKKDLLLFLPPFRPFVQTNSELINLLSALGVTLGVTKQN